MESIHCHFLDTEFKNVLISHCFFFTVMCTFCVCTGVFKFPHDTLSAEYWPRIDSKLFVMAQCECENNILWSD